MRRETSSVSVFFRYKILFKTKRNVSPFNDGKRISIATQRFWAAPFGYLSNAQHLKMNVRLIKIWKKLKISLFNSHFKTSFWTR